MFSYFSQFKDCFGEYSYPKSAIFYLFLFHLENGLTVGIGPPEQTRLIHLSFISIFVHLSLVSARSSYSPKYDLYHLVFSR